MVLVAAIAAGVLINTAGFLQSKSQQTGEESSAQVTNQLQVVSKTGIVNTGDRSSADVVKLNTTTSSGSLAIDSGDTIDVRVDAGGNDMTLTTVGGSTSFTLTNGETETVKFEVVSETEVRVTNTDSGASITFDPTSDKLELDETSDTASDADVYFASTFEDSSAGETTINKTVVDGVDFSVNPPAGNKNHLEANVTTRTSSFLQVDSNGGSDEGLLISDGETINVLDGSGDLVDGDGNTLQVSADDNLTFVVNDDRTATVTNEETGASITFDATTTGFGSDSGGAVKLEDADEGATITTTGGSNDFATTGTSTDVSRFVFERSLGAGNTVTQINLLVAGSAGSGDIDMSQTVISVTAPDGSFTLTYGQSTVEDEQFTITAVQDDDDTVPVLTSGDRFEINIDLGPLSGGDTVELRITTGSGATKVVQLRVPDSLANKEAVGL
jgi:flagellin FlaA/flagellin FlaB